MNRPGIIITGASGFVGRHLVQALRDDFRVYAIGRRSQARSVMAPTPVSRETVPIVYSFSVLPSGVP